MASSEGCGRFSRKTTVEASGASIASTLRVPFFAGIEPELRGRVLGLAHHVEGELDVLRGEGLAVVPLHVLPQEEDEVAVVVLPGPALGQLRHDGVRALELLVLVEDHQVAVAGHGRPRDRVGRRLVDGEALGQVLAEHQA